MKQIFHRTLIVAAHPDDEILGAGGLLSVLKTQADTSIRVLFICEGSSCRFPSSDDPKSVTAQLLRQDCCLKALQLFNVTDVYFTDYPCGNLNLIPILSINKLIEHHLNDFKPTAVLTHYSDDCNNDHRIVSRSVDMALRPVPQFSPTTLLHFEIQSSTDWNFSAEPFQPNFFIPLTDDNLSQKTHAMSLYYGEYTTQTSTRGSLALTSLAHIRGLQSGSLYAEAYRLIRHSHVFTDL